MNEDKIMEEEIRKEDGVEAKVESDHVITDTTSSDNSTSGAYDIGVIGSITSGTVVDDVEISDVEEKDEDVSNNEIYKDEIAITEENKSVDVPKVNSVINPVAGVRNNVTNNKKKNSLTSILIILNIFALGVLLFLIFVWPQIKRSVMHKPVLYLYPTEDTRVTVGFDNPDLITVSYPELNKEWNVYVTTDGNILDDKGNNYYALYWEEKALSKVDFSEGFYVEDKDSIKFLEEKLSIIGLNDRERNEFIMYWLPILKNNKKSLVYFELTEEKQAKNKLNIDPKPDSLLRVTVHVKKVNKKVNIKTQSLPTFERNGFVAVEWGGIEY